MTDGPYNADDLGFLLSRSLDERLSETDRVRLETALAADAKLAGEASAFRRTDALLKGLSADTVSVDGAEFETGVMARVAEAAEERSAGLEGVDDVLGRWAKQLPTYDEKAFATSVMREVRRSKVSPLWHWAHGRMRAPMAIAAAILFAVTLPLWVPFIARPVAVVRYGGMVSGDGGRVRVVESSVVVFVTSSSSTDAADCADRTSVAYLSVGSEPVDEASEEGPPI